MYEAQSEFKEGRGGGVVLQNNPLCGGRYNNCIDIFRNYRYTIHMLFSKCQSVAHATGEGQLWD